MGETKLGEKKWSHLFKILVLRYYLREHFKNLDSIISSLPFAKMDLSKNK